MFTPKSVSAASRRPGRRIAGLAALMLSLVSLPACFSPSATVTAADPAVTAATPAASEFRGVWVATVLSLNYPSRVTTDRATLERDALNILDNARDLGFNAVFFQVRPAADAFYASSIFPWSKYLTGAQGTAPEGGFDPLAFMVRAAHERGLELHAWLNPYRVTAEQGDTLAPGHPALVHPEWTVSHSDGKLYWNPGEPGAQQLIADGVREIVERYDVDGIHIDDYFYPGADFNDAASYAAYGGAASLADWRRANTETTVRNMRDAAHASDRSVVFGVSPVGIWANRSTSPLGSDTCGGEAYTQKYADTRGWVKRGLVDYIAPQIYWNIGFEVAEYITLVDWWADAVAGTGVRLYIGQAAYRTGNADPKSPWNGVAEIERQLRYNRSQSGVSGYIMYSYASFLSNPALSALMRTLNAEGTASSGGTNAAGANGAGGENAAAPAAFSDVAGHWAEADIASLKARGVVLGDNGLFRPESPVKRADFVLMLNRTLGTEERPGAANFADVEPGAYYAGALAAARESRIVTGVGDDRFEPEAAITRQDMFTMIRRALIVAGRTPDDATAFDRSALAAFADASSVADYAASHMIFFVGNKIVTGNDLGLLEPLKSATRAETAAVLCRVLATLS